MREPSQVYFPLTYRSYRDHKVAIGCDEFAFNRPGKALRINRLVN